MKKTLALILFGFTGSIRIYGSKVAWVAGEQEYFAGKGHGGGTGGGLAPGMLNGQNGWDPVQREVMAVGMGIVWCGEKC